MDLWFEANSNSSLVWILYHFSALWICHKFGCFGPVIFCVSSGDLCSFYINLPALHLQGDFWCLVLGLRLEPGAFWATLLCQDIQVPPLTLSELNSLTEVFKTASRSAFPCWDSQQFWVSGLSLSTPPVRIPTEMWEPSSGKSSSRHQPTTHIAAGYLGFSLLHSIFRGPQDPTDFWESHLFGSLQRGKA